MGSPCAFPFPFSYVGPYCLYKEVILFGDYEGFKVGMDGLKVYQLKYYYDIVLVGVTLVDNLLTIKEIFRSFELTYRFKVN